MYGAFWCPDTHAAAKTLKKLGIPYIAKAVENPATYVELSRIIGSKEIRRPTIFFPDGTRLIEPNNRELRAKIKSLKEQGFLK